VLVSGGLMQLVQDDVVKSEMYLRFGLVNVAKEGRAMLVSRW